MSKSSGFRAVRAQVIEALQKGHFLHESRNNIDVKNLLAVGAVSVEDVIGLITRAKGTDHQSSPHHLDGSITVHVIKSSGWYIKFYFLDPDTWFISVHK
jgi:hypothetical protein